MAVVYKQKVVGNIAFGNVLVHGHVEGEKIQLFSMAIRNIHMIHLDEIKGWMQRQGVRLGIIANFNGARLNIVYVRG